MRSRTSDYDATAEFARLGLTLSPQILMVGRRTMHYVTGKSIYLVGYSLGGPMVVKLVAYNPDLPIRRLFLLAGPVSPADEPRKPWRVVLDAPVLRFLLPGARLY